MPCSNLCRQAEVRNRFAWQAPFGIDMSRGIVGQGLDPTPSEVMFEAAAECAVSMKLSVEKADIAIHPMAKLTYLVCQCG